MHLVDLTHPITANMPVFPGTKPPVLVSEGTLEQSGFREKRISICSHTGTHIDAPAHLLDQGPTLDMLPLGRFCGQALVVDVSQGHEPVVGMDRLQPYQERIFQVDFLLLHTGWSRYWGRQEYFSNFPVLTREAAQWLTETGLKGIGLDAISADRMDSLDFEVHTILLGHEVIIIENLTNLNRLPASPFFLSCFPLSLEQADGSPVRAVAWIS